MSLSGAWYLGLAAIVFTIGAIGLLVRRNVLIMFMCIELMLNAANLTFVTFARMLNDIGGQAVVFFVLVVAAAEVVVGLGIVVTNFRRRGHHRGGRPGLAEGLTRGPRRVPHAAVPPRGLPRSSSPSGAASATRWPAGSARSPWAAPSSWPASCWPACSACPPTTASSSTTTSPGSSPAGCRSPSGTLVDPLSMTMCMFVTGVSALIHLYSIGYMKGDRDYSKFFIYLNLFVFSMLLLVLADNLLLTFVGWEGVGVCSYWLVAFWFQRESAASAGKKAFIYNRIGDVGFLLAIFLIFEKTGTIQYESGPGGGIFGQLSHLGGGDGHGRGAAPVPGRHRQVGPDPAVQLAARRHGGPDAGLGPHPRRHHGHGRGLPAVPDEPAAAPDGTGHRRSSPSIGAVTAFVAATIACAQQDIKKVLAFSTVSQIGYMMLAVGTGAYIAAIFLMVAHAFFKGLLFLGAGSVIHGLEDEQDLKRMGALRRYMKWTTVTFTIGFLAIAGIPPLSGFWAKGDVLDNVFAHYKLLWVIGLVTAVLTAYYMSRLEILAFGGEPRFDKAGPARRAGAAHARTSRPGSCASRS